MAGVDITELIDENFRLYFNIPLKEPPPAPEVTEGLEDELYEELVAPPKEEGEEAALEATEEQPEATGEEQPAVGELPEGMAYLHFHCRNFTLSLNVDYVIFV